MFNFIRTFPTFQSFFRLTFQIFCEYNTYRRFDLYTTCRNSFHSILCPCLKIQSSQPQYYIAQIFIVTLTNRPIATHYGKLIELNSRKSVLWFDYITSSTPLCCNIFFLFSAFISVGSWAQTSFVSLCSLVPPPWNKLKNNMVTLERWYLIDRPIPTCVRPISYTFTNLKCNLMRQLLYIVPSCLSRAFKNNIRI